MLLLRPIVRSQLHQQAKRCNTKLHAASSLKRCQSLQQAWSQQRRWHSNKLSCTASATEQATGRAATMFAGQPSTWQIKMLHDGDCPLCEREVNFLRSKDQGKGNIAFVDIAAADYKPEDNAGISYEQAMDKIHAILPDGTVVTGIEVFRRLYEAVGLGWVYAATRNPTIAAVANTVYDVWAKYRLAVTGRPPLEKVLMERTKQTCADVKQQ